MPIFIEHQIAWLQVAVHVVQRPQVGKDGEQLGYVEYFQFVRFEAYTTEIIYYRFNLIMDILHFLSRNFEKSPFSP